MSAKDFGKISGYVEIIVKDKDGKVKYHIGAPPRRILRPNPLIDDDAGDCPFSSFPAKLIDLEYWRKNVITNVGLACIVRLVFAGLTEDKFGYLGIGSGTTSEAVTDTELEAEIIRKSATVSQETTSVSGDTAKLEATFSSADGLSGTMNISEAGVFNASAGGDLLARKVFSAVPIDWDAGDTLTIRYYIQFTR
ncbi:MAG: hypothetical protein DRP01_01585 [Archaeoglobales archaeon]|nr:MAG: hypothetical protein DRP01_01585 [Archaeoglobales archaeon]